MWKQVYGVENYPKGTVLFKGATKRISMNIPVAANGKTQIPINLWSKNLSWSFPWKTNFNEVNNVSGCLYDGPFVVGVYGFTKTEEFEILFSFFNK